MEVPDGIRSRLMRRGAGVREIQGRPVTATQRRVLAFTWIAIVAMLVYVAFMGLAFFQPGYSLIDRIAAIFLLGGIFFIMLHGLGYANSMVKASWGYDEVRRRAFSPNRLPKVACVVATFNEPTEVLDETLAAIANVDYPNKEVWILDDSTREEARQATRDLGERFGVRVRQRTNRRGYKAGAVNDFLQETDAEYIAVFDADSLPAHNFLRDMVPVIDENPRLAFVQTPQFYANTEVSDVALAAHRQQAVFYEYICEGKSHSRAAFCCGTNVIFRRDALQEVGGFDESSVTEDFATSLRLHSRGYDSTYYNQVYVYGLGPETLPAYFTQQSRWAFGSVGAQRKVIAGLFRNARSLRLGQWWEYLLSAGYYWIGWVNFIFMLLPMVYIFFGIRPLRADVFTYLLVFVPYFLFSMNMFYMGMEQRGYRVLDMLLGQQINFICFPVHMTSAVAGILGRKRPFGVTPKGVSGRMSWLHLWPQLLMMVLSAFAFLYGMFLYLTGRDANTSAIVINSLWALYHTILLAGIFRLNRPLVSRERRTHFEDERARATQVIPGTVPGAVPALAGATVGTVASPGLGARGGAEGPTVFAPAGTVVAPPPARTRPGIMGRLSLVLGALSLLILGAAAFTMLAWAIKPSTPVNVYLFDRTAGRDYQEHRALTWTLNFLKIRKAPELDPAGTGEKRTNYNFATDYYGFIPGDPAQAQPDPLRQGDLLVYGEDRPLPETIPAPGLLFLADAYSEFVEFDYSRNKYIRYRNPKRGILPEDVDRIEAFYESGGLLVGEWNTIGYPTLPGVTEGDQTLRRGIEETKKGLRLMNAQAQALQARINNLRASGRVAAAAPLEQQWSDLKNRIAASRLSLANLQAQQLQAARYGAQLQAQRRLERMLHVHYLGWYGRYVDHFEQEREYDFRMWKNVVDYLRKNPELAKKFRNGEPTGPGLVLYRDGPSTILDPETKKPQPNPFSEPLVIFSDELADVATNRVATIYRTGRPELREDPLLYEVAEETPYRFWFDVVQPQAGSSVLAYYKLRVKPAAARRLREAGFPAAYINQGEDGIFTLTLPAAIAHREGEELRSFYFAGDASDYPLVGRLQETFPSTGGINAFLGSRAGPIPLRAYWNYYEPFLRNIFTEAREVRATAADG